MNRLFERHDQTPLDSGKPHLMKDHTHISQTQSRTMFSNLRSIQPLCYIVWNFLSRSASPTRSALFGTNRDKENKCQPHGAVVFLTRICLYYTNYKLRVPVPLRFRRGDDHVVKYIRVQGSPNLQVDQNPLTPLTEGWIIYYQYSRLGIGRALQQQSPLISPKC